MELVWIALVALGASLLTFFSGFGLGTLLTPVFLLFFPVEVAIALTGIVHFLNNVFKTGLMYRHIDWTIGLKFGLPAVIFAGLGAYLLSSVHAIPPLFTYTLGTHTYSVTPVKALIAVLMMAFALLEVVPSLQKIQFDATKLVWGGALSGFFGGLSGQQGALRSMFLVRSGLSKEGYIATGILIACAVDVTRLSIYFFRWASIPLRENMGILLVAVLSAFMGAYAGNKLLKKITLGAIQRVVAVGIFMLAIVLGMGWI